MAEWFKAPVLKTGVGQPTVGSNPTPSAQSLTFFWGGARVVEWGRLLSGCWVISSTEGSNPSLPALSKKPPSAGFFVIVYYEINLIF